MIFVRIDQHQDFGREMRMAVIERKQLSQEFGVSSSARYEDFAIVPHAGGGYDRIPLEAEGATIKSECYFLRLNQMFAEEFLRALTIELARLGYSNPDPYDYRSKAMESHIKTLDVENRQKHELLGRVLGIVERSIGDGRHVG